MDQETAQRLLAGLDDAVWTLHAAGIHDGPAMDAVVARRDEAARVVVDSLQLA